VILHRTRFDLEQQLYDITYTLHQLQDVLLASGAEAHSLPEAVSVALEAYRTEIRRGQQQIGTALRSLTLHLRLLAGNIEIAAAHADDTASTQIELFCTISHLLRSLADQLHGTAAELRIFEQTQLGHSESLRSVLTRQNVEVGR
jgi:ABC-type transporter Mla subunit MlaD